jgi:hypothetical protein
MVTASDPIRRERRHQIMIAGPLIIAIIVETGMAVDGDNGQIIGTVTEIAGPRTWPLRLRSEARTATAPAAVEPGKS